MLWHAAIINNTDAATANVPAIIILRTPNSCSIQEEYIMKKMRIPGKRAILQTHY